MGKPQSTGNLVNALAQDSSNNIGIGGAANASFKLQVTGTSLFTDGTQGLNIRAYTGGAGFGAIYSSGVTAGAGNFALAASATQTILSGVDNVNLAINSAIKLAIASTGAATFSSSVQVGSASTSTGGLLVIGGSSIGTASSASGQILIGLTPSYRGSIAYDDNAGYLYIDNTYNNNSGNIYFRTKTGGTAINALTIAGTGVSTFSSAVILNGTGVSAGTSTYLQFNNAGTAIGYVGSSAAINSGASTSVTLGVASGAGLTIASNGAATFSSSVNVNGATANNDLNVYNTNNAGISLQTAYTGTTGSDGFYIGQLFQSTNFLFRQRENADIIFETNNGSERMRITSGGLVGIGTSTPTSYINQTGCLAVVGNTISNFGISIDNGYSAGANGTSSLFLFSQGALKVRLDYARDLDAGIMGTVAAIPMLLFAGGSERMRITSGGYLKASNDAAYLNATGTYHEFTNNSSVTATTVIRNTAGNFTDNVLAVGSSKGSNSNFNQIAAYTSDFTNIVFKVRGDGNVYNVNGVYTSGVSDIKYKEQIVDTNSQWDDIKNLRVVNFKFIKDVKENGEDALRHIGFIAQEVEKVSPNLIEEMTDNETGETWKTIKTSIIHTKAIKALQECMARIEEQQAQIEELNQKVNALENK